MSLFSEKGLATFDMFQTEYGRWREMSGQKQWDCETVNRVFGDLIRTAHRANINPDVSPRDKQVITSVMPATALEHQMRQAYRMHLDTKEPTP
jgi:hypothetical protein